MQGRGRRQTERISNGRQGQKAGSKRSECIGSPGKQRENAWKCQTGLNKTSQCVLLICVCVNEVQVW